ncbi:DUF6544 family protein [Spirosoma aerolatum]|uniref:DUF6544 family protein n=1 Tax=Spirosoma aerolatum TaxID=1211326 RepID=UPI001C54F06B|nr:DUF6544 family protein [Spirosoma aerolatum]
MLRVLFIVVLITHGLIQLMGFVSQWQLAILPQLTGRSLIPVSSDMAKVLGIGWLVACVGFVLAAVSYGLRKDLWLVTALLSIVVSQALIVVYWPDAKAGTIANLIVLVVIGFAYANLRFDQKADQAAQQLLAKEPLDRTIITTDMLVNLPEPVKQWLMKADVLGKEKIRTVRLRQQGLMRTRQDGKWMAAEAEQYFTVDQPGFVWKATIQMAPLLQLNGFDQYKNGHGGMTIQFMSLINIADEKGPEMDQGALVRFLSEIIWFPTAVLSSYIRWEAVDDRSAKATMTYGGVTASGIFRFNSHGDIAGFEAQRYRQADSHYILDTWTTTSDTYRALCNGIRIPTQGAATWKFKTGDFTWYKLAITAIDYNQSALY